MSNQEILEKVIQKAVDGGWNLLRWKSQYPHDHWEVRQGYFYLPDGTEIQEPYLLFTGNEGSYRYREFIFNHNFCKALWGEELVDDYEPNGHNPRIGYHDQVVKTLKWRYHLQQMVIADDPIKYLGENI